MRSELFAEANRESQSTERWVLQSKKMLRVGFGPEVLAAKGAMVAYQGQFDFKHEGSGGLGKFMKKMVSGEGGSLMRVGGQGEVFFARQGADVFTLTLEGEGITINTSNLLAFDANLQWDIKMLANAGMMTGGLFNLEVGGCIVQRQYHSHPYN